MMDQTQPASPHDNNRNAAADRPPEPVFLVEPCLSGTRIDSFLSRHLRNYSPWRISRMVSEGRAWIDDLPASCSDRVFRGQQVRIRLLEPPDQLIPAEAMPLRIVYEDPWLLVVDKPAGVVAHPVGDYVDGTLINGLQHHLDQQTLYPGMLRPGIVHRIDRMTSGLLVTVKEHLSHRLLSIDFQHGKLSKSYLALVDGRPDFDTRMIELPIGRRPGGNSVLMSAAGDAVGRKPARTRVTVLERQEQRTLVECTLFTGRNHQIRVHLSQIGYPIQGDEFYGPGGTIRKAPRFSGAEPSEHRHALHATRIGFLHPILREWMEFRTAPPADFYDCGTAAPEQNSEDEAQVS